MQTNSLTGEVISDDKLRGISALANKQLSLERDIAQLEEKTDKLKQEYRNLQENLLPSAMLEVGLSSFKLSDGTAISIDTFYAAKIPEEHQFRAFKWLRDTGNESIIKREVKMLFGKGEDAKANLAVRALKAMNLEPADKSSVHPMTLKSFVREKIESGEEFPQELFGVFVGNRAKLTPAKS